MLDLKFGMKVIYKTWEEILEHINDFDDIEKLANNSYFILVDEEKDTGIVVNKDQYMDLYEDYVNLGTITIKNHSFCRFFNGEDSNGEIGLVHPVFVKEVLLLEEWKELSDGKFKN